MHLVSSSGGGSNSSAAAEEVQFPCLEVNETRNEYLESNVANLNMDDASSGQEKLCHHRDTDRFKKFCVRINEKHSMSHATYKSFMTELVQLLASCDTGCKEVLESIIPSWKGMISQKNYTECCKTLGLVSSTSIVIGESSFQYVSIIDTLSNYISHPEIFELIYENSFCGSVGLSDFTCGSYFVNHSYFKGRKDVLRLHLFCDDIEICNALGSSRTKNKLTCIYYFVGNIGPENYSKLKHIMLALVVKTNDLHHDGYEKILEPLIADIQHLEKYGLSIYIDHGNGLKETYSLFGTVATLSADNLAAHEIGGFRCCFSSGKFCRYCFCSYEKIKTKFCSFKKRDAATHNHHIRNGRK